MKTTIIIPKKIKVGFNPRTDTYTGMLGYVIYHDGKVWRKETSWESWRYHYMPPEEYEIKRREAYEQAVKKQTENWEKIIRILDNLDGIYIRAKVKDSWGSFSLGELVKLGEEKQIIDWIKQVILK